MNIGIVGGSIAGCSAAILLMEEGHQVMVFERSDKALVGRGGGIGTTPTLIDQIKQDGLIDNQFAYLEAHSMPFVGKTPSAEPYGRTSWSMPINLYVFQWNELWQNLRQHVPHRYYQTGTKIVESEMNEDRQVILTTESGERYHFDLVLFADGYRSIGRGLLFPEKQLKYRGYVLWRGLLPENEMEEVGPLKDEILRLSYAKDPGHQVMYFIPNRSGSVNRGERVFNWGAYVAIDENYLPDLMTDRAGRIRKGTLPPGMMSKHNETMLKDLLSENIPAYYAEVVAKTNDSYLQVVYTLDLDAYYKDRMCLIGDAGMVVQPFTGSGVFKGYQNVKDLIQHLNDSLTVDDALEKWSLQQTQTGKRLLALGEQMERAFIWEPLDFAQVSEAETAEWWEASVAFPEDFNYQKG